MAEKLSDKFARLKPMEDMSLGELDVRACILNKSGRSNEALILISHGISRISTGQTGTKHDLCLFFDPRGRSYYWDEKVRQRKQGRKNYQQAFRFLEEETLPILTKVRVLKSYGKFLAENKKN